MSTNKERIQAVTSELSAATTTINNLPDYPDLENIYGSSSINILLANISLPGTSTIDGAQDLDGYVIYTYSYNNKKYFCKYNKSSQVSEIIYECDADYYGPHLAGLIGNKLCMFRNSKGYTSGNVTCYDLVTGTSQSVGKGDFQPHILGYNDDGFFMSNSYNGRYVYYYSITSNTITTIFNDSSYTWLSEYTLYLTYHTANHTPYCYRLNVDFENCTTSQDVVLYRVDNNVKFINTLENKIVYSSGDVYSVNNDKTIGEKLNTISSINFNSSNLYVTYYNLIRYNDNLYEFNETTNDFDLKYTNIRILSAADGVPIFYNSVANTVFSAIPNNSSIIGFKYNNRNYSIGYNTGAVSNKLLAGTDGIRDYNGQIITGTMPNNGTIDITPSTSQQTIPEGYTSGGTVSGDANLVQANIRAGVTIFGVEGNLQPDKPDQTKTVTPTTSEQLIEPDTGYELASVTVNGVTAAIDNNIVAENIRDGVTILGVTGTLEEGYLSEEEYADCIDLAEQIAGISYNEETMDDLNDILDSTDEYGGYGADPEIIEDVLDDILGQEEV